jgi:glycine cleavage system H lipoate-binding protein
MLVAVEQDKVLSFRLDPQFFTDLGQPVQVYFPIQLQDYVVPGNIICVVESSRKLVSLKSQHSGVFRMFNKDLEAFPEKLAVNIEVFRLQPLSKEDWDKEQEEKATKKKPAVKVAVDAPRINPADFDWLEQPVIRQPLQGLANAVRVEGVVGRPNNNQAQGLNYDPIEALRQMQDANRLATAPPRRRPGLVRGPA